MKMKKIKQEKQETKKEIKLRYLNDKAVGNEAIKWIAIFITLIIYDMNPISKVVLGIIFIVDLGATKYVMEDLALKILMITLILSAFIADMTIMDTSFITELLIVLIIIGVAGYKYVQYYFDYKVTSKERGDYDEK